MEQLKKMVPVVAVGLAVAAMSSVDAYAAEEPVQPVDAAPPAEEVKQETPAPSTEINTAVAVQTPEGSEPPETDETPDTSTPSNPVTTPEETPGQTTTELVVNPGTDAEGNLTQDGTLTNTTTPGEKTEVTEPTGDPTTTVTTNPDGSTTTTTTTPNQTTTTENSSSTITGNITDEGKPSEGEMEDVKTGWAGFVDAAIKRGDTVTETPGLDNSTIYTIEHKTDPMGAPLTAKELETVLGVTLTPVAGKENTYTYTSQDGKTVTTVTVTDDASTETTTTRWTITVKENSEEKTGSYKIPVKPVTDFITDAEAKAVLDKVKNNEIPSDKVEKNSDGNVTKVIDGTKTYEFTYLPEPDEKVDISKMTAEQIIALLPEGQYRREGNEIFDKDGHKLTFTDSLIRKVVKITMTVTDSHGSQSGPRYDPAHKLEVEQKATSKAMTNAVIEALQADAKITKEAAEAAVITVTRNDDGSWTATVTIGQRSYSYIVSANKVNEKEVEWIAQQDTDKQLASGEEVASRFTTFVSNTAYISGSTVIWSDTMGSLPLTAGGVVALQAGDSFNGATVERVTQNENGTTTVVTKDNVTNTIKTYTFTYTDLDDGDKADLLQKFGETADFSNLKKTTWVVTVTSDLNVSHQTITLPSGSLQENVKKTEDGYIYTLDNGNSILLTPTAEKGLYESSIIDGKLYVLTETTGDASESVIDNMIRELFSKTEVDLGGYSVEFVGNTAIYTDGKGSTVTVEFSNVADKVSVYVFDGIREFSASSLGDLEKVVIDWIEGQYHVDADKAAKIYDLISHAADIKDIPQYILKAQGPIDQNAQSEQDLLKLLQKHQEFSVPIDSESLYSHITLKSDVEVYPVSGGNINDADFNGKGYINPEFNIAFYESANDLVQNKPFANLNSYTLDFSAMQYTDDIATDFLKFAKFYKVTGTMAHGFLTNEVGKKVTYTDENEANACIAEHPGYEKLYSSESECWYICKVTEFTASGCVGGHDYLDGSYNINLGKLFVSKEQTGTEKRFFTSFFTNVNPLGDMVTSTLTLENGTNTVIGDGHDISGSYQVTETKDENSFKREDGGWLYEGMGSESYNGYRVWEESKTDQTFQDDQYSGNLKYSYTENTTDVKVDASVEKDRDVQVKLDQTSVTTVTGETSTSTTTPAPSNPGGSSGSSGSGSSSRPSSRPSNPSTPENPSVNIPEEDVPLTNLPNEDIPLSDLPEETPTEQPPVTELPEEDVPLAETPVQARAVSAANTTRISDAQTPLADVPETGDPMLMEAFAAAAAGANALWFSMGKKRRDDAE